MKDLIDESAEDLSSCGYETLNLPKYNVTCSKLFVDSDGKSKQLGFDKGHYFILHAPLLSSLLCEHESLLIAEIGYRLSFLFKQNKIKKKDKILFVGIGNPEIMADSFGAMTVSKLNIKAYKKDNYIYKLIPNTFSNTGMNAYDIIKLVVKNFGISAVFLFDSLATCNIKRLGCSIQFNDAGLTPGSAMNNFGMPINKSTLNVPCFSVGVPMMISSVDMMPNCEADIILTEKDAKEKLDFLSSVIAHAINSLMN